jgi:CubicO group peptidase (beta-lactamase class C family)
MMKILERWAAMLAVVTVATFGLAGCGQSGAVQPVAATSADGSSKRVKEMDETLSKFADAKQFRGSVVVARGNEVLLDKGYDLAVVDTASPNTPQTRFRIGTLTKQFTSLAVLKAQDLGKLKVQDPVCQYVPSCPAAWKQVTVEQLLTHTSGIPDYAELSSFPVEGTQTPEQLVGRFRDRPLNFPAGDHWQFSNSGFALAGYIIERATGTGYADFLRSQILDPLGMADSGYDVNDPVTPAHAVGYDHWGDAAEPIDMSNLYSAGAMYSTTTDLLKWNRFLMTGTPRIVAPDTLAQLLTPRVEVDPAGYSVWPGEPNRYAYGLMVTDRSADVSYFHGAGYSGFSAFNLARPKGQLSITVLSNLGDQDAQTVGMMLAEMAGP